MEAKPGKEGDYSAPTATWRILVVDDEEVDRISLQRLLGARGHRVEMALDGVQAIEVSETFRPHLILLDIQLPKLNGHEVCRHIRGQPWGKTVSIYAMTAGNRHEEIQRAREAGFDGVLSKPIDAEAVARLLPG
jgi:CheY-like chemotaxis protein